MKKLICEALVAYCVLFFFLAVTLFLTYLNINNRWEPFLLKHLIHQNLITTP
ncbi:MAG: hypothetical protein CFH41_02568 [Alphaproteobacteria bacterium MarineAlpha11_Bin1]|nr:MAG: hypothetical protein CFH41_02568 [Alphaproteobacteria bacterium MarineAlpha11_Bin1]